MFFCVKVTLWWGEFCTIPRIVFAVATPCKGVALCGYPFLKYHCSKLFNIAWMLPRGPGTLLNALCNYSIWFLQHRSRNLHPCFRMRQLSLREVEQFVWGHTGSVWCEREKRSSEVKAYHFPHYLKTPQAERWPQATPTPTLPGRQCKATMTSWGGCALRFLHALPPTLVEPEGTGNANSVAPPSAVFTLNLVHRARPKAGS